MAASPQNLKTIVVMFTGALVLCTCLAGAWMWLELRDTASTRTSCRAVLIAWQQIYSNLKDAETGMRGYVITEDERYLEPFNLAVERLPFQQQELGELEHRMAEGNSLDLLTEFSRATNDMLDKSREIITVARREGAAKAAVLLKEGGAKKSMDEVRRQCEARLTVLDKRLRGLDEDMKSALNTGGRSVLALSISALIAGLASWGLLRDILLQARRTERLTAEKQKADRANREKSTFLATMSHEIRTPMNAILGFGELLHSDARDEKQKRYAGSIVRSGQALLQLINDILDLSKIEAGMLQITTQPVNVREIADFTRQLFGHQCAAKGVDLNIEVAEDVPASLLLDGARLRQIVLNLVGNAIKFTNAGHVSLKLHGERASGHRSSYRLALEVADTGSGIPADRISEIFDPFVQAKASRDTELKGTGLGLAIVKRLVNLMGGTIEVRSEEGKGSTFTVLLPQVEISARLPQALSVEQQNIDFNDLKASHILVVDDNPTNLAVVQGYFDGTHHTITTASNGKEALAWLEKNRPDVMLMDIRMPVMDGRTALAELRKRSELSLLPVIAVTASSLTRDEEELRASFDGYVRKPYSRAQLYDELMHFLPRHHVQTTGQLNEDSSPVKPAWGALVERLREMERRDWQVVKNGMVMSQVTKFSSDLLALARTAECPPLESYASSMQSQAETFSLDKLEKTLNGFPALIEHLEQRILGDKPL